MLTFKAKSIYNDFVGIKVADFILTITLYIDKCLSLTTAIVSDRFSFAEENTMENDYKICALINNRIAEDQAGIKNGYFQNACKNCKADFPCEFKPKEKADNERPKGEWVKADNLYDTVVCNKCGGIRRDNRIDHIAFCNKCGAKMISESED